MKSIWKLFASIILCEAAGGIGAIFTTPAINTWYAQLTKPSFNPPNWLFGPVWSILFALMGIALYLIWLSEDKDKKRVYQFFFLQLSLNILWSVIFFGMKLPIIAFVEILILWVAILLTTINFYKISKIAGYILIPYLLWVSFAAILNYAIANLN
jgi:tryptophan-rich sensory protein